MSRFSNPENKYGQNHSSADRGQRKPRGKQRREIPMLRPGGYAWSDRDMAVLNQHADYLFNCSREEFNKLVIPGKKWKLKAKGWSEVLPGLWTRSLIGPMTGQEAADREYQEYQAYREHSRGNTSSGPKRNNSQSK